MATSGTVGQTIFDAAKLVEHILRRCQISPAAAGPEKLTLAKEGLFLFLSSLPNSGVHLWSLQRYLVPLSALQTSYTLPTGAHDVKEVFLRTPVYPDGAATAETDALVYELDESAAVLMLRVTPTVSGDYSLAVETSDDGVVWETRDTQDASFVADQSLWLECHSPKAALFIRLRDTAAGGTLDGDLDAVTQWSDRELTRESRDRHAQNYRPYATNPGTFYVERVVPNTKLILDRAPASSDDLLWVWARREVEDIGDLNNDIEVPKNWYLATINNAALNMAVELPAAEMPPDRLQALISLAQESLARAESNEGDESDVEIDFNIGVYTR